MADSPALFDFVERLNGGHVAGSLELSKQTVHVLERLIRESSTHSVGGLLDLVRNAGHVLIRAKPQELVLGNIVRRILSIIREAHAEDVQVDDLQSGYDDRDDHAKLTARLTEDIRETIAMEISDLHGELDLTLSNVKQYALDHIHSNEVVLTFGDSNSVASFLIAGGRSRNISVIVAESGPNRYGAEMCAKLARHGIRTTLVPDSHVHAVMPAVNKVVLGAQAVLADGALLGFTGSHNLAACARVHAVPVLVVAGLYKFSPLYAFNQDTLNAHNRPSEILSYGEASSTQVHIFNPAFDYVPSTYIHLFITNVGTYHPSYVYRLLSESYDQADLDI